MTVWRWWKRLEGKGRTERPSPGKIKESTRRNPAFVHFADSPGQLVSSNYGDLMGITQVMNTNGDRSFRSVYSLSVRCPFESIYMYIFIMCALIFSA